MTTGTKPSMFEIYMKTMPKGMHSSAFQGKLRCPWFGCNSNSWTYVGKMSMYRLLYKCKKCGQLTAYDVSRQLANPYIHDVKSKDVKFNLGR
jgi:hypothetical protein